MGEVIGYSKVNFKPQDSSDTISGLNIWVSEKRDGVEGVAVDRVFLSDRKAEGYVPKLGQKVSVQYNRYGKVDRVVQA